MAQFGIGSPMIGADPVAQAMQRRGIGGGAGEGVPLLDQQSLSSPTGPGVAPPAPVPVPTGGAIPAAPALPPEAPGAIPMPEDTAALTPEGVIPPGHPEADIIIKALRDRLKAISTIQQDALGAATPPTAPSPALTPFG